MMARLFYDARIISGGYSGIARYTGSLLIGLLNSPHLYDELTVLFDSNFDYNNNENYSAIKANWKDGVKEVRLNAPPFSIRHHCVVSRYVNKQKPDLYFYPHFDVPYWIRADTTFVIHDLFAFYMSNYFGKRNSFMKTYYRLTITKVLRRKQTRLITVSQSTLHTVAEVFGDSSIRNAKVEYESSPITLVESGTAVPYPTGDQPFLLYVGSRRPNKNLKFIIEVFKELKEEFGYRGKLMMISGTKNWNYDLDKARSRYEFIELINGVNDSQLKRLYHKMDALFYPSLYEGFGMPIVEAAAQGKKIITSNKSSMKEIAPEWALLIDPESFDHKSVAGVIASYLAEDDRPNLADYPFNQLSWKQIAERIFSSNKTP
jgi:glycosyltransferase involved in cell wall biosynthesis